MTDIKAIAPGAIDTYRDQLNTGIDEITEGLNALGVDITNVNYGGKNAFQFKSESAKIANELSSAVDEAIKQLAKDIAAASTGLSNSFGGPAIVINLSDNTITPADPGEDTEEGVASISSLQTLSSQVDTHFTTIANGIKKVADLPPNTVKGWMGDQRNRAQTIVDEFVSDAQAKSNATRTSLTAFIGSQITALDGQ